nr:uncharacterized protein LOC107456126 [Parasteatoda tepidariorum]
MVERFHRSLKQSLKCHNKLKWTESLPIALLGLRSAFKEDLKCTSAELVYGMTLRLPGEFLAPTSNSDESHPSVFVNQLKNMMPSIAPTPASSHSEPGSFVHPSLASYTHVFVRHGVVKKPLQTPYDGLFQVIDRAEKFLTISINNKPTTISIDRLKPSFSVNFDKTSSTESVSKASVPISRPPSPKPTSSMVNAETNTVLPKTNVTRSGRRVRFNSKYL